MAHTVCRGTGKPGQAQGRKAVARSPGFLYFCFLMNRNTQHSLLLPVVLHVKTECWVSQIAHIVSVVQITDNLHPDILGGIIQEIPANCARDEWNEAQQSQQAQECGSRERKFVLENEPEDLCYPYVLLSFKLESFFYSQGLWVWNLLRRKLFLDSSFSVECFFSIDMTYILLPGQSTVWGWNPSRIIWCKRTVGWVPTSILFSSDFQSCGKAPGKRWSTL